MMDIRYVIKMKIPTRPDLDYYYCGRTREENSMLFDYRRPRAKRYTTWEEADRDRRILMIVAEDETLTVETIRCRT